MEITDITRIGTIDTVTMMGRVDSDTAGTLEKTLTDLMSAGSKEIVCDFSSTTYISSAGLRVLLSVTKTLVRSQGRIVLCSLRPNVALVFTIAGFNQIMKIYPTRDAAIKVLAGDSGP
ncbi:MAG: STAS domain-containing protein [Methanomicrobiales archaeon]